MRAGPSQSDVPATPTPESVAGRLDLPGVVVEPALEQSTPEDLALFA